MAKDRLARFGREMSNASAVGPQTSTSRLAEATTRIARASSGKVAPPSDVPGATPRSRLPIGAVQRSPSSTAAGTSDAIGADRGELVRVPEQALGDRRAAVGGLLQPAEQDELERRHDERDALLERPIDGVHEVAEEPVVRVAPAAPRTAGVATASISAEMAAAVRRLRGVVLVVRDAGCQPAEPADQRRRIDRVGDAHARGPAKGPTPARSSPGRGRRRLPSAMRIEPLPAQPLERRGHRRLDRPGPQRRVERAAPPLAPARRRWSSSRSRRAPGPWGSGSTCAGKATGSVHAASTAAQLVTIHVSRQGMYATGDVARSWA